MNIKETAIDLNRGVANRSQKLEDLEDHSKGLVCCPHMPGFFFEIHPSEKPVRSASEQRSREAGRPGSCHFSP